MASEIFAIDVRVEPRLVHWAVHVIVVDPFLVARVIGRVNVDAFYIAGERGQQSLQGEKIIPVDDEVVTQAGRVSQGVLAIGDQLVERHSQVITADNALAFELE